MLVSSNPMQMWSLYCPPLPLTALDFPVHVQWWCSAHSCWAPKAYALHCITVPMSAMEVDITILYLVCILYHPLTMMVIKPIWFFASVLETINFSEIADPFACEFLNMCNVPFHDSCNKSIICRIPNLWLTLQTSSTNYRFFCWISFNWISTNIPLVV